MEELIRIVKENNALLKQILEILSSKESDFLLNVLANVISNKRK